MLQYQRSNVLPLPSMLDLRRSLARGASSTSTALRMSLHHQQLLYHVDRVLLHLLQAPHDFQSSSPILALSKMSVSLTSGGHLLLRLTPQPPQANLLTQRHDHIKLYTTANSNKRNTITSKALDAHTSSVVHSPSAFSWCRILFPHLSNASLRNAGHDAGINMECS